MLLSIYRLVRMKEQLNWIKYVEGKTASVNGRQIVNIEDQVLRKKE